MTRTWTAVTRQPMMGRLGRGGLSTASREGRGARCVGGRSPQMKQARTAGQDISGHVPRLLYAFSAPCLTSWRRRMIYLHKPPLANRRRAAPLLLFLQNVRGLRSFCTMESSSPTASVSTFLPNVSSHVWLPRHQTVSTGADRDTFSNISDPPNACLFKEHPLVMDAGTGTRTNPIPQADQQEVDHLIFAEHYSCFYLVVYLQRDNTFWHMA